MQASRRVARRKAPVVAESSSRHHVRVAIGSPLEITKADIRFEVRRDDELVGTLFISRGAVAWKPRNGKHNYKFNWTRFDEFMQSGTKTRGK